MLNVAQKAMKIGMNCELSAKAAIPVNDLHIQSQGLLWRYQQAGSGPALMLVHGLLGYSFSWRHALPVFAQHATVYAVDLPGTGYSGRPKHLDCSLRASAQRLLHFMDDVGIGSCDLLGTSHGGALSMMAAALDPQRFRSLILVAPVNPWSAHGKILSVLFTTPPVDSIFLRVFPRLDPVHEFYFRRLYGDTRRIRPGTLEGYRAPMKQEGSYEYALNLLRTWNHDLKALRACLPAIADIPTLLAWGDRDAAVNPASAACLKKCFRDSRLCMMEGVGHLPYEEAPEQFNQTVVEFLQRGK